MLKLTGFSTSQKHGMLTAPRAQAPGSRAVGAFGAGAAGADGGAAGATSGGRGARGARGSGAGALASGADGGAEDDSRESGPPPSPY